MLCSQRHRLKRVLASESGLRSQRSIGWGGLESVIRRFRLANSGLNGGNADNPDIVFDNSNGSLGFDLTQESQAEVSTIDSPTYA